MNPEIHVKCEGYQTACLEGKQKQRQRNYKERLLREKRTDTERERKWQHQTLTAITLVSKQYYKEDTDCAEVQQRLCEWNGEGKCSARADEVLLIFDYLQITEKYASLLHTEP